MKKARFNIKGETLTETIIALSILAIAITITSTVILNSMRNLTAAKQRVVAVNIAREGIEAVRGIRDSNWLLYSDRRRQCWNHNPDVPVCDGLSPLVPGVYVAYKHQNGSWRLAFADDDRSNDDNSPTGNNDGIPDNDPNADLILLSFVDIDTDLDSDGDTVLENDKDMYNHMALALEDTQGIPATPFGTTSGSSPFSRTIVIEYLEDQPNILTAPSNIDAPLESINTNDEWTDGTNTPSLLNRMRVTSVASWMRSGVKHSVELKTIITDHLGREDLSD